MRKSTILHKLIVSVIATALLAISLTWSHDAFAGKKNRHGDIDYSDVPFMELESNGTRLPGEHTLFVPTDKGAELMLDNFGDQTFLTQKFQAFLNRYEPITDITIRVSAKLKKENYRTLLRSHVARTMVITFECNLPEIDMYLEPIEVPFASRHSNLEDVFLAGEYMVSLGDQIDSLIEMADRPSLDRVSYTQLQSDDLEVIQRPPTTGAATPLNVPEETQSECEKTLSNQTFSGKILEALASLRKRPQSPDDIN